MEKDPVCGMLVDPVSAAGERQYQGVAYHFCSPQCLQRFSADPSRYAVSHQTEPSSKGRG